MSESFAELRAREFARLDAGGHVYLDYTGAGLYGESQIRRHGSLLRRRVLGNPHSENPTSHASTLHVEEARRRVLGFFHADPTEYAVVFTANATGALKLIGEAFPFHQGSRFVLLADNHNSVNGIREFARRRGASVQCIGLDAELRAPELPHALPPADGAASLFAYPAQSNFTGVKHPLEWIEDAHERGYHVLLDAAAFVPTNPLDLSVVKPDFVSISFYKMFGYPTGVGALLLRHEALRTLERPWFAGGTVRFASAQNPLHLLKADAEAFEDGTPNFLAITAVPLGLDMLEEAGMVRIREHVLDLTRLLLWELGALRHADGTPLVRLYGPASTVMRGGTVAFNLQDAGGVLIESDAVQHACTAANISLRSGCFCNPGAAEHAFGYAASAASDCLRSIPAPDFSLDRFSDCMGGAPVGAVRVSVGLGSNAADLRRLLDVLKTFRDQPAGSLNRVHAAAV